MQQNKMMLVRRAQKMFKLVLGVVLFSFSVDAMNPVCDQKALSRRVRSYAEMVLDGKTIDKKSLVGSLQFLSEDALRKPMIAIWENESMFLGLCEWISSVESASNFVKTCKEAYSEVGQLKKVQLSMLLSEILGKVLLPTDGALGKLMAPSGAFEPFD